jgi:hypothetical protein
MIVNLDELKDRYRPEEVDTDSYGVYIELEAFALIRELLGAVNRLQEEVYSLREHVNLLSLMREEEPPYPEPAYNMPGDAFYVNCLINDLYEKIFDETNDR